MRFSAKMSIIATSLILCASQGTAFATECSAKSGAYTVPLLELYTSEGCSSCPPADNWLSGLKSDTNKFTPLAFHVDYWDYIGWKDRFAKTEYSDRQRKMAAFGGLGFVYTPQFVMNGRDFRSWGDSQLNHVVESSKKLVSRANLGLDMVAEADGAITLVASAQTVKPADGKNSDVFVALYENNLVSQVKAGENSGRELKHDYVVREFFGAYPMGNLGEFSKKFTLSAEWKKRNAGAVIFIQNNQTGEILQSLALPFCKESL